MSRAGNRNLSAAWAWVRARRLNLGLLLLLVVAIVATVLVITSPGGSPPAVRTATVTRGDVTALVTGSGNAESSLRTPVSFEESGTVTSVTVQPGDTVTLGQTLATVDDAGAQAELRTAEAQLAGAQAALDQARAGPTDVLRQQDQLGVTQAQQALDNARAAVTAAQKQLELDRVSTQSAIDSAKTQLSNDDKATATAVENAEEKLEADTKSQKTLVAQAEAEERAACGSTSSLTEDSDSDGTSGSCASAKLATKNAENTRDSVLLADKQAVTTAEQTRESTLDQDRQAVTEAEQTRAETLLTGETTVETNKQAVTKADGDVTAARLSAEANLHPRTPEEIAQAQATVDSAQVDVDTARSGVEDTALKAPQAGVVLAVNGEVGESAGGQGSDDGSSGDDSDSDSGGSSDSAASDAATSAGDGFVVIANVSELAVTADIPEADAADLELGQPATLSFPGTETTATGTVTRIDPQSTVSNDVVLYPVTISLDAAPEGVGVGATANMSITTGAATAVLKAPTQAITTTGNRSTVTVRRDGVDTVVPVRIGVSGPAETEIVSGVADGDVLVLPSQNLVTGGAGAGFPGSGGGR